MEKQTKIIFLILFVLLFSVTGCKKSPFDMFTATGPIVTETRELAKTFYRIKMCDNIDVELVSSDEQKVEVTAGANLMQKIKTTITFDSCLIIANENQVNWVRSYDKPLKIRVYYKLLRTVDYHSVGNLTSEDTIRGLLTKMQDSTYRTFFAIQVQEGSGDIDLKVNCQWSSLSIYYGTANLTVSGYSAISTINSYSYGYVDAQHLRTLHTYMGVTGSNDCKVHAENELSADITNIGDVYYYGNPKKVIRKGNGKGRLIKME